MGRSGITRTLAFILTMSLVLLSLSSLADAATTPAIKKAQNQAAALQNLIDQLSEEMSAAAEDYDTAQQQLEDTQSAIKKTQKQLTQSTGDLATLQERLSQRVVEIYKSGDLSMLNVLLEASSFSDLIGRYEQLQRLSDQDAQLLEQVSDYKAQMAQQKTQLDSEKAQEQASVKKTASAKAKVTAQLAKQKKALKGKEVQIAQLKAAEQARQAALVAAAKKAAADEIARARAAAAAAKNNKGNKGTTATTDGGGGGGGPAPGYDSDKAARVVQIAMQYVGVPYVWGGSSPSGFDCSGLCRYAYAKVGVSLPHSSAMMYNYGVAVSRSELKPGDLVFYYSPIHHVGMYIGGGQMVNATGDHVQVGAVWKSSYHGARRILN
jgi:peptidoglycan DL-endopeptidase CwlO